MKKYSKNLTAISLAALMLLTTGCSKPDTSSITVITPAGAPALAFYDQGANENFQTNSNPKLVGPELKKANFDAVVFDSINALKMIKGNKLDFALARILTGGNFYLVSIDHDGKVNKGKLPAADSVVVSFGQGLIPDLVYGKLCKDVWHIENNANYVAGVSDLAPVLKTGVYSSQKVDYVFCAQPILYKATSSQDAPTYGKVNVVKDIRAEWKAYSGQDAIPQAGLLVRKSSVAERKDEFHQFLLEIDERIDNAINHLDVVKNAMNTYNADPSKQIARFGFDAETIAAVQTGTLYPANGCALVSKDETVDVNAFLNKIDANTYGEQFFDETFFVNL